MAKQAEKTLYLFLDFLCNTDHIGRCLDKGKRGLQIDVHGNGMKNERFY